MFDFFGLPRELRDYIYDNMTTNQLPDPILPESDIPPTNGQDKPSYYGLKCHARSLPSTNPLLVSKQFHAEYRERTLENSTIVLRDHMCNPSDAARVAWTVTKSAANLTNLLVELTVSDMADTADDGVWQDLHCYLQWIPSIIDQLPNLRRCTFDVHVMMGGGGGRGRGEGKAKVDLAALLRGVGHGTNRLLEGRVTDVYVYEWRLGSNGSPAVRWDYGMPGPLLVKWSRRGGVVSYLEAK